MYYVGIRPTTPKVRKVPYLLSFKTFYPKNKSVNNRIMYEKGRFLHIYADFDRYYTE